MAEIKLSIEEAVAFEMRIRRSESELRDFIQNGTKAITSVEISGGQEKKIEEAADIIKKNSTKALEDFLNTAAAIKKLLLELTGYNEKDFMAAVEDAASSAKNAEALISETVMV